MRPNSVLHWTRRMSNIRLRLGALIFVFMCGIPAMEVGNNLSLASALMISALGGLIGGSLMCPKPLIAGALGGLAAGPPGLVAVYFWNIYHPNSDSLFLVLVQGAASLPGVGLGWLIIKLLDQAPATDFQQRQRDYLDHKPME